MNGAGEASCRDGYVVVRDGLALHYCDYAGDPTRPPLLCLHGLTRNCRDFTEFAERYSPAFRVLCLDFRGRGMSDYDPFAARYTPLTYAADVVELLDRLEIPQAVFVGTSLGGLVTMTVGAMAAQRIAGAILNDIGPALNRAGLDRIGSYLGKAAAFGSWEEAGRAIAASQSVAHPNYGPAEWIAMARRNCRERDGAIVFDYDMAIAEPFRTAGAVPTTDMWPLFAALARKPLLVVRGELSELLSAEAFGKMQAAAPDARFVTVAGVGHAPALNEPEAVAAIDQFLASLNG